MANAQAIPMAEKPVDCDNCLVGQGDALWKTRDVEVCWEQEEILVPDHGKTVVRNAIARTWGGQGVLNFVGWNDCQDNSYGIRISVRDTYTTPLVLQYGSFLDGFPNGMQLNFNLFEVGGYQRCFNRADWCIEVQAIHEFGHAIGFHHEQRRSDINDVAPTCAADHPNIAAIQNELILTEYDANSVMNYCNVRWAGYGRLSEKDIAGYKKAYAKLTGGS
jgi:hypothetical protein